MNRGDTKSRILALLGAGRPYWLREWVLRDDVLRRAQSYERALAGLQEIIDAGGKIYTRVTARGIELLLVQAPNSSRDPQPSRTRTTAVDDAAEMIEDNRAVDVVGGAVPRRESPNGVESPSHMSRNTRADKMSVSASQRNQCSQHELVRVFGDFGVVIDSVSDRIETGPSVVRHRILPGKGVRLSTLRKYAEDVARVLGYANAPLFTTLPGESFVAMDVPRSDRQFVSLWPAIEHLPSKPGLWSAVGVTPAGEPVAIDLTHLIVAGATGSGKSIFLESMVLCLARLDPSEVELLIIDPKAVDFLAFEDLPHLRGGRVITDPTEAVDALRRLLDDELPARTNLLRQHRCVNMRELRARGGKHPAEIVLIVDEFSDLIITLSAAERSEFEQDVLRLAQRARSVGIHVVLCTQRPTAEFVSGAVKANIPTRICFRVAERIDSGVVLDRPGAECLLGKGDGLLLDEGKLQRVQGYWVTSEEISERIGQIGSRKGGEDDANR
jgi:DNA segregation ATPase FtsK/SpoIIIE-like protein